MTITITIVIIITIIINPIKEKSRIRVAHAGSYKFRVKTKIKIYGRTEIVTAHGINRTGSAPAYVSGEPASALNKYDFFFYLFLFF